MILRIAFAATRSAKVCLWSIFIKNSLFLHLQMFSILFLLVSHFSYLHDFCLFSSLVHLLVKILFLSFSGFDPLRSGHLAFGNNIWDLSLFFEGKLIRVQAGLRIWVVFGSCNAILSYVCEHFFHEIQAIFNGRRHFLKFEF